MYAPRVIENVTMLTFNVIDFSVITRDAEADAICATLNKFEEALKSRISIKYMGVPYLHLSIVCPEHPQTPPS